MKTMVGLIRAEILQHRGSLLITPLVIAGLIAAFVLAQLFFSTSGVNIEFGSFDVRLDGRRIIDPDAFESVGQTVGAAFGIFGVPIFFVANVLAFFVMLSALYEERAERTVLFFKSMPVSDTQAVLAKYVTASFIGPFIAIAVMMGLTIVLSLSTAIVFTVRGVPQVWGFLLELPLLRLFTSLAGYYSLYALWVAPIFAYLLMMSALAPRSPFLFALLPVAVAVIAEAILFGSDFVASEIGNRGLAIYLAEAIETSRSLLGARAETGFDAYFMRFTDILATLAVPAFWIGLGCAGLFLTVAIWSRSRKTL
ncbi:MAG: hypothetical protein AAGJ09_00230 [Pseudomonadota bacterium]